jgi:hypothetical protein
MQQFEPLPTLGHVVHPVRSGQPMYAEGMHDMTHVPETPQPGTELELHKAPGVGAYTRPYNGSGRDFARRELTRFVSRRPFAPARMNDSWRQRDRVSV